MISHSVRASWRGWRHLTIRIGFSVINSPRYRIGRGFIQFTVGFQGAAETLSSFKVWIWEDGRVEIYYIQWIGLRRSITCSRWAMQTKKRTREGREQKQKNEARQNEAMGKIQFAREKRKSKWSNGVTQIAWCLWGTTHIVAIHFDTMQFIALHSLLALWPSLLLYFHRPFINRGVINNTYTPLVLYVLVLFFYFIFLYTMFKNWKAKRQKEKKKEGKCTRRDEGGKFRVFFLYYVHASQPA